MKLSDQILAFATWLESPANELLAQASDDQLDSLAMSLVAAAEALQEAAVEVSTSEPQTSQITSDSIDEMAAVAAAFAEADDELLQKQATVLDEVLSMFGTGVFQDNLKRAEAARNDILDRLYKRPTEFHNEDMKNKQALDAIKKSPMYQERRPLQEPLQTRSCPDHPGSMLARVAEDTWQCQLDRREYNWQDGFTTLKGNKVPGTSISEQTLKHFEPEHIMFDHRDSRLGINRD